MKGFFDSKIIFFSVLVFIFTGLINNTGYSNQNERCEASKAIYIFGKGSKILKVSLFNKAKPYCTLKQSEFLNKQYFYEPEIRFEFKGVEYILPQKCVSGRLLDPSTLKTEITKMGFNIIILEKTKSISEPVFLSIYLADQEILCPRYKVNK